MLIKAIKGKIYRLARSLERYTKADMVYFTRSSFWTNLNFIISAGVSFTLSVALAKFVSKENYGIYQYILSVISILTALSLTGSNPAIIQSVSRGFEGTLRSSMKEQFYWSAATIAGSIGLAIYYALNGAYVFSICFTAAALLLPISNITNSYSAYLTGKRDFRKIFIFNNYWNIIYIGAMLFAAVRGKNALWLALTYLLVSAIMNAVLYIMTIKSLPPNDKNDPEATSFAKHLSLMNILTTIAAKIDSILIFHYLGAAQLAIYAFAKIIPDKIASFFKSIVSTILPKLSPKSFDSVRTNIHRQILILSFTALACSIMFILIVPWFYSIFFPNYIGSIIYAKWYSLSMIVLAAQLPSIVLISQKATKKLYTLNIINPIVQIGSLFFALSYFGLIGVIVAKVLNQYFSLGTFWFLASKKPEEEKQA